MARLPGNGSRSGQDAVTVHGPGGITISPTVCEPCKRRKKGCDKELPSCGRCIRLLVKCTYGERNDSNTWEEGSTTVEGSGGLNVMPSLLDDVVPGHMAAAYPTPQSEFGVLAWRCRPYSIEDHVLVQVRRLLSSISGKGVHERLRICCQIYFRCFNWSLPVVNHAAFWARFKNDCGVEEIIKYDSLEASHFSVLVLAIVLVSFLYPQEVGDVDTDELYATLRSMYSLLQATGKTSIEMVQVGILVASWEWCQNLQQNAWLSIGGCVRAAQVLGLHHLMKKQPVECVESETRDLTKENIWWCCVVLERIIQSESPNMPLPCASSHPHLDDFLPEPVQVQVSDGILLPQDVNLSAPGAGLQNRELTLFSPFSAAIQATLLLDLVMQHISQTRRIENEQTKDGMRLNVALQNFTGACIPAPGKAVGGYCGPFGIRTTAEFLLHQHTLSCGANLEAGIRAKAGLQSLTRIVIHVSRLAVTGMPMDFDSLAFWSHKCVHTAALMHIKYGDRDEHWKGDLEVLKAYLTVLTGRFGIYTNYIKQIEDAQRAASSC